MTPKLDYLPETPSQTAGPYVHIGLIPHQAGFDIFERPFSNVVAGTGTPGERIRIEGRVLDGLGQPCRDILLEVWQANAAGRYNHPADRQTDKPLDQGFRGWGVIGRRGYKPMAPHVNIWFAARGINIGLSTRMYFADETALNAADPVLRTIEPAIRRETLLARREVHDGAVVYVFDVHLQGEHETVFFDV
ncbi:MAG: protocatechuate 3,4-dioxygenase subunit alpha [Rhodopila sp.]